MRYKTFDEIPLKYRKDRGYSKVFQEISIIKDMEDNFIIEVYFLTEIRLKKEIRYKIRNKKVWLIKKDGIAYKIFRERLEALYSKPISKEIYHVSKVI